MDVDEGVLWLLTALRLSRGPDGVEKEKLIQNVNSCFLRVKKERKANNVPASQAAEELRDFQAKASLLLLLCLPQIRELPSVQDCEDFQSMISSLPELSEDIFFAVVRTQKTYFLLAPLLSWLPPSALQVLTKGYFCHTDEVTPVTLTISVELLKTLLFSNKYWHTHPCSSQSNTECLELLVKFFSLRNVSNETPAIRKFSGYLFMYMFECLYLLLACYVGRPLRAPDSLGVEAWTKLWKTGDTPTPNISLVFTKETIKSVLVLCQNNNREVSVDMWMEWSEQMLPQTVVVHPPSPTEPRKGQAKSIQLVTCNIAFDILRVLESHPHLEEDLATRDHHELLQFLQQVAADPEYDPDRDLSLEQLLEQIQVKDDRQRKLVGLLVHRDDVMTHDGACRCLREHAAVLDGTMRVQLVQQWIEGIKANKPCIPEAVNVMLDLAADLSAEQLRPIIEGHLSSGLDVILKTPSFNADLTAVFNQLADENTAECSGRHVWLCLQSGREVVEQAVRRAVTMTGLVPVMVQALADLPQVCQAKLPSGQSLLASSLAARQPSLCGREEPDFVVLVQSLLRRKGLLDAQEVLHLMVEPFLVIEGSRKLDKLITPLELLQELVGQDGEVVVRAGPAVVSLVLALAHVVDATVALEGQGPDGLLDIRCLASAILMEITNIIMSRQKKFEREISVLKGLVCGSGLHPWSVVQLSQLLDAEPRQDSSADLLLRVLVKAAPDLPRSHGLSPVTCAQADGEGLQKLSRSEWTISLLQLLPHCSEREWISAFFLTDHFHGSQNTAFPVLEVFQGVLRLVCSSPPGPQGCASPPGPQHPPASLHHCFTSFASAAMIYVEEKCQVENSSKRFLNLADIFCWWCCLVASFRCNPELPALLLARLCAALEEIVVGSRLKDVPQQHTQTDAHVHFQTTDSSEKETESLPKSQTMEGSVLIGEEGRAKNEENSLCHSKQDEFSLPGMNLKKELDQMTFFMVKYVPYSNLLASVASKLKKLYEF